MMAPSGFRRDERGSAAIEFGLTAPAFLALLFGALQGALMLWTQLGLQHAVERAARCAAINASLCGTSAQVQAYAVTQGLANALPTSAFTLVSTGCVSGTANVRFVISTVSLSARSCFPT